MLKEMKFDASVDDMKKFILIYLTAVNAMGVYQPDKMYKGDVTLIAAEESVRPFGQEVELAVGKVLVSMKFRYDFFLLLLIINI